MVLWLFPVVHYSDVIDFGSLANVTFNKYKKMMLFEVRYVGSRADVLVSGICIDWLDRLSRGENVSGIEGPSQNVQYWLFLLRTGYVSLALNSSSQAGQTNVIKTASSMKRITEILTQRNSVRRI